ncbi:hypothetical protein AB0P36_26470 [Streptomyces flavidovirens]|uniref:hypothetical protein n=1 Tax=Streptomyces flavidovirens TaxID=67298 RepID=UPI003438A88F
MTTPDFRPTHVVPGDGLAAWEEPDVSRPTEPLDPLLPVQLIGRRGDWGQILCANGWSAWVDGRLLVSVPQEPPASGQPMARTADPRPLLARVEESVSQYRRAAEDLTAGRTDGEGFRRRTRGLRVGMVVEGESVWLYDAEHERWVYCDGTHLVTYAATSSPGNSDSDPPPREPTEATPHPPAAPPPEPTQVVTLATPPEPTQVVPPAAPDDARPSPPDPKRAAAPPTTDPVDRPGAGRAPDPTRPAPPEPTRIVDPGDGQADSGRTPEPNPPTGPGPGRATPPEPTRTVDPPTTHPGKPPGNARAPEPASTAGQDSGLAASPEPTRIVDPPTAGPNRSPAASSSGAQPEPTRVVGGGAGPPDDAGGDGDGRGREATRVVEPPGDAPAPHPPTRPGDG